MSTWIIIAALGSIGITALLASLLWRINKSAARGDGGDAGVTMIDGGSGKMRADSDGDSSDGGGDGGGGD
jgi:hypothetical protein